MPDHDGPPASPEAAATIARMRLAHLADRERLVFTHRQLAGIIVRARGFAAASDGEPWAAVLLGILGDAGVCTLTAEDEAIAAFGALPLGAPHVLAASGPDVCSGCRFVPCGTCPYLPNNQHQEQQ